ncbi:MAG: cytochrome c [Chloroflexota bacterium]
MTFFLKLIFSSGKTIRASLTTFIILYLMVGGFVLFSAPAYAATPAEQGQAIFEQKCQGCHTIGGGRLVGPNLNGITSHRDRDWLIRFITIPDKLIAQGDPIAREIVQEYGLAMPNLGLTDDDARAVLAYIESQSSESKPVHTHTTTQTQTTTVTTQVTATTASIGADTGRDLFTGKLALKNGGPACLSCHNISAVGLLGGGTVGKDLTTAYSSLGETAIGALLKTTPFPMMKEIYTAKPLTDEEIAGVTAFLKEASSAPSTTSQNPSLFFIIGGAAALLIIGLFQWLWRGRLAGVRRPLVKGGSK